MTLIISGSSSGNRNFRRLRIIIPQAFQLSWVGSAIINNKAIPRNIFSAGRDFPLTLLRRGKTEEWLVRMNAHRLRRAKIVRVGKNCYSRKLSVDPAADVTQPSGRRVTITAILSFCGTDCG